VRVVPPRATPHPRITEIVDRVVKSRGGPGAAVSRNPPSPSHPLRSTFFGHPEPGGCALAFRPLTPSLERRFGRRLGDVLEMQPPQGLRPKGVARA